MRFRLLLLIVILGVGMESQLAAQSDWFTTTQRNYAGTNNQDFRVTVFLGGGGNHWFNSKNRKFETYFDTKRNNPGNSVNGLGWRYGWDNRQIKYKLQFFWMNYANNKTASNGKVIAGAYGWLRNTNFASTSNFIAEYYVVEKWAVRDYDGRNLPYLIGSPWVNQGGSYWSNGSWYDVYETRRVDAPNITGTDRSFNQYWAIRRNQRGESETTHTIDMKKAFAAWRSNWFLPDRHDYQVFGIDAYNAEGGAAVVVTNAPKE